MGNEEALYRCGQGIVWRQIVDVRVDMFVATSGLTTKRDVSSLVLDKV